jgi:hypothetical protein
MTRLQSARAAHPPIVPPIFRRGKGPSAAINALLLLAAALGGEWIVHQIQYLISYGSRFDTVMAATPHRYYMHQVGAGLGVLGLVLLGVSAAVLALYGAQRAHLLSRLPERVRTPLARCRPQSRWSTLWPTALVLAWIQIAVYVGQENAEARAQGLPWPGLGVLFPAHYPTVLPLHLLLAVCISALLWSICLLLRRSREGLQAARVLLALYACPKAPACRISPAFEYIPSRRPVAGPLGLRAPPLAA